LAVAFISCACFTPAQINTQPDPKTKTVELVRDVTALIAKHWPTKKDLRTSADRIAKTYQTELKAIPKQVKDMATQADNKLKGLAWREKLNLALELWRIRSSLDLLTLVSPDVLSAITGLKTLDFNRLVASFGRIESRIEAMLPSWAAPHPTD
jgi:hypothetical protein